jgi:hypothetical protein
VVETGTDPDWTHVVLLLGFEGVDGSQGAPGFTDESPRHRGTAAVSGGSQLDTAQFKFGTSSLSVTGTLPLVVFSNSSDFDLSDSNSDQFTIECWARFTGFNTGYNSLVSRALGPINWRFAAFDNGALLFQSSSDGSTINVDVRSAGAILTTGIWYHLAVDKDSTGKIRLYRNGVPVGSSTPLDSSIHHAGTINISIGSVGFGGSAVNGWIDEVRVTKGVARYQTDASFTPPTAPFPRGAPL